MGIEEKCKLYIRFPVKIVDKLQIRSLHPDILEVHLPRQKSRRWCFVTLANRETLEKVSIDLKELNIDGKKLVIGTYKIGKKLVKKSKNNQVEENLLDIIKQTKQ